MVRPWITPDRVREYSASAKVKERTDTQLKVDITRAESYVIFHTHNSFDSEEYEKAIPADVEMAVILLAEGYALKSVQQTNGGITSETFDDYSYTMDADTDPVDNLLIGPMLDPYVISDKGKTVIRLRKL